MRQAALAECGVVSKQNLLPTFWGGQKKKIKKTKSKGNKRALHRNLRVQKEDSNKNTTTINSRKILMIQIIWQEQEKTITTTKRRGSRKCFIIFFHINLLLALVTSSSPLYTSLSFSLFLCTCLSYRVSLAALDL